jgi:hypothetical protein
LTKSGASQAKRADVNRREWPRYMADKSFALAASLDGKILPCQVVDVSLGGAKLVFEERVPAAKSIELSHPESEPVHCAAVWRSETELGIEFDFSEDSLGLISICLRSILDHDRQAAISA